MSPRTWHFTVLGIPPGPNIHTHWRNKLKETKPLADALAWEVKAQAPTIPLDKATVVMTIRKMGISYDLDNSYNVVKHLGDALTRGGLIVDDGPDHLRLTVKQERAMGRQVWIQVTEGWE